MNSSGREREETARLIATRNAVFNFAAPERSHPAQGI
jgi:hypothetical protein